MTDNRQSVAAATDAVAASKSATVVRPVSATDTSAPFSASESVTPGVALASCALEQCILDEDAAAAGGGGVAGDGTSAAAGGDGGSGGALVDDGWGGNDDDANNNEDDDDEDGLGMFTRISSNEIVYRDRPKQCKVVGHYIFGDLLGEGAFGKVKECIDKDTLERRAVKIFKRRKLRRKLNGEQNLQREIVLLKRLRHTNVLRLYDVLHNSEKQKIYMVLEFCVCQLKEMLDHAYKKRFPLWQAHDYFHQLMSAVEYIHSQGVVHNDIKPANLLLTADGTVKLCDLGTAEQLSPFSSSDLISSSQGSPAFQPPEIALGNDDSFSGFKVDVWSCGVTLFNFVTGLYPFEGETVFRLYDSIGAGRFQVPDHVPESLAALLRGMLARDVAARLTVAQIKQHEWCRKRQPRTSDRVPIPTRNGSVQHTLTVLPYIWQRHYGRPLHHQQQPPPPHYHNDDTMPAARSGDRLADDFDSQLNITANRGHSTSDCDGVSSLQNTSQYTAHNQSTLFNSFRAKSWSHCRQT